EQAGANLNLLNSLHNQQITNEATLQRAYDQQKLFEIRMRDRRRPLSPTIDKGPLRAEAAKTEPPPQADPKETSLRVQLATKQAGHGAMRARYTPKYPELLRVAREVEELERQLAQFRAETAKAAPPAPAPVAPAPATAAATEPAAVTEPAVDTDTAEIQ